MPTIIKQSVSIEACLGRQEALELIERIGRTCYKSECQGQPEAFVDMILNQKKHHSVIEHCSATLRFVTNRGVTHEMVRHRIAAYTQESTRFCNYAKAKFGSQLTFIEPVWWDKCGPNRQANWQMAMEECEERYMRDLELGATPQEARDVLPNALKTEIVTTYNFRQWLHVFSLRLDKTAHPQMIDLMRMAYVLLHDRIPEVFSGKQLQHLPSKVTDACTRCGLAFSSKTAYIPCFEEWDTFEMWEARNADALEAVATSMSASLGKAGMQSGESFD